MLCCRRTESIQASSDTIPADGISPETLDKDAPRISIAVVRFTPRVRPTIASADNAKHSAYLIGTELISPSWVQRSSSLCGVSRQLDSFRKLRGMLRNI